MTVAPGGAEPVARACFAAVPGSTTARGPCVPRSGTSGTPVRTATTTWGFDWPRTNSSTLRCCIFRTKVFDDFPFLFLLFHFHTARRNAPGGVFLRNFSMPPDSPLPRVIDDCHGLLRWLIPLLDQFPRSRRFTLGERLESGLLDGRTCGCIELRNVPVPALASERQWFPGLA